MSNTAAQSTASLSRDCAPCPGQPVLERIQTRPAEVGEGLIIHRALPNRQRRMVGAWCFLDHAGPIDFPDGNGLNVGPHPHIGLQTFTWMIEGEVLHRDSLGYEQLVRPGQVNLMTAGNGIAHAEHSVATGGRLHAPSSGLHFPKTGGTWRRHSRTIRTCRAWCRAGLTSRCWQEQRSAGLLQWRCTHRWSAWTSRPGRPPVRMFRPILPSNTQRSR
ncbi:hypothetical protein CNECB9_3810002 [Cupriavidus necator]|uniref:Pirin N-terminal domain-containing protein n=1 Tax=Cupriavidus necator TaxID=106590 RepID=A0A1K0JQS1_CUPNE|nr:hypothetical protein CNECB9_3810002 [Cupriavidus necator]